MSDLMQKLDRVFQRAQQYDLSGNTTYVRIDASQDRRYGSISIVSPAAPPSAPLPPEVPSPHEEPQASNDGYAA